MNAFVAGLIAFFTFLLFQAQGITTGDAGDLVTAAATFGVAHPPGYPLYTFLGWITSHLPIFTVAWRVGLLSSIPHAVVVGLVFHIVWRLTRQKLSALFAGAVLAGNYLFFLYSVTPEVFALLNLFLVVIIVLAISFVQTKRTRFLYGIAFVFGLSLTHHHMILFFVPALAYLLWVRVKRIRAVEAAAVRLTWGSIALAIAGLFPYLYVVVAARGNSIISWDHATTLANGIRLVTRADYGTFVSSAMFGGLPIQRFLQLKALAQYVLMDFTVIGLIVFALGLWYLWNRSRVFFGFLVIGMIFLGPVFLFYASFPLINRFTLGTYERFLLPLYTLMGIVIGLGHAQAVQTVSAAVRRTAPHLPRAFVVSFFIGVTFLYPVVAGGITVWKFWGLPGDRTAEHLAEDVLAGLPPDSLVALGRDTVLFTTQYARYVKSYRTDTIVLHGSFMGTPEYQQTMRLVFPQIIIPEKIDEASPSELLVANTAGRRVFSNIQYPVRTGWHWVPYGLVFELMPQDKLPDIESLRAQNDQLWNSYRDPTTGLLSRYNHLMLSDVRDIYAHARIEFGRTLLRAGDLGGARKQFEEAIRLAGDTELPDAYTYKGITHMFLKECDDALASFATARTLMLSASADLSLYEAVTYRDCVGDEARAAVLFDRFETWQMEKETPLEQL